MVVLPNFIDCGGVERTEVVANFQLWEAKDYDHRLAPQKFLHILDISKKILGNDDLPVEVEYQQSTIGKFGLEFNGKDFVLTAKQTACLAQDACGIPHERCQLKQDVAAALPFITNKHVVHKMKKKNPKVFLDAVVRQRQWCC